MLEAPKKWSTIMTLKSEARQLFFEKHRAGKTVTLNELAECIARVDIAAGKMPVVNLRRRANGMIAVLRRDGMDIVVKSPGVWAVRRGAPGCCLNDLAGRWLIRQNRATSASPGTNRDGSQ